MNTFHKVNDPKNVIFRCPDQQWPDAIAASCKSSSAPAPMPWDHVMWSDPASHGYVNADSTEQQITAAWEAQARAFLPSSPEPLPIIVKGCAKAMRVGASPVPFLIHQITA